MRAVDRHLLDYTHDPLFTRLAALAANICGTTMAAVSLVDGRRNWFLGVHGLDPEVRDVRREEGLCGAVIDGDIPQLCRDVKDDAAAQDNLFVRAHDVRSYACEPIVDPDGHALGTVAVMGTAPRSPTDEQLGLLGDVAAVAMAALHARLTQRDALIVERRLRDSAEYARDDAVRDRDGALRERDDARTDRDAARSDRREAEKAGSAARSDRESALHDRDVAHRDREYAERDRDDVEAYATVLQQTLLPPVLPTIEGMRVGAHYRPASALEVGGDFYDVFPIGEDRWAFFIGDVEGHGVGAAVATSLVRYTLRSAVLHHHDLRKALGELNTVMLRELSPRRLCTVLLGTITRAEGAGGFLVTVATGGHVPAVLLDPSARSAQPVRSSGGVLVGAVEAADFESCSVRLRPGQTLVLHTDGITEARRGADAFDDERFAEFLAQRADLTVEALIGDVSTLIAKLNPGDDAAVLALRCRSSRSAGGVTPTSGAAGRRR